LDFNICGRENVITPERHCLKLSDSLLMTSGVKSAIAVSAPGMRSSIQRWFVGKELVREYLEPRFSV